MDKGVGPVRLVDPEVSVEVVSEGVPGDDPPSHASLQTPDLRLGGARDEDERRVPRVQVGRARTWSATNEQPDAGPLRVALPPSGYVATSGV